MGALSELIRDARLGAYDELGSAKLSEIAQAVKETGRSGKLSLSITVKPDGEASLKFEIAISGRTPAPDLGTVVMYCDDDGNLQRSDPRQAEMFAAGPRAVPITGRDAAAGGT